MRGVKSNGMLLCASNDAHDRVEPLSPPEGAAVGERVWFGEEGRGQPAAAEPNRVQKKKIWETCQPDLKTSGDRWVLGGVTFRGRREPGAWDGLQLGRRWGVAEATIRGVPHSLQSVLV